ncbi:dTMP kinase [Kineococcus rhizosphaerae]|uniref:Thymidylate kinase n=1 Tax=Kineococcus rhizosphaerae TaxID=559628 RepID=A0A2T0R5N3_9ACTN|nr:dTMP kinase [Kineococcus rhizosphaerae]PRY16072.1 thymidylate kinase [Kineococcus rhizosphaerae]
MTRPAAASATSPGSAAPDHDVRALLRDYPDFRRMWLSLMLSSFGDWLGMLAKLGTAASLTVGDATQTSVAVSTVFILQLAPAALLGPLAGALADRLDRRLTMVVGDVLRFALFASIPLVGNLTWLFAATLLIELVTLFWGPAKDATVPNLVPRNRLEVANQISLVATYGSAPVAGLAFILLTLLTGILDNVLPFLAGGQSSLAMYVNALTFLVAAAVIWRLDIPPREVRPREGGLAPTLGRDIVEGWRFVGTSPLLRGLVLGMLTAFAAGGVVLGLGRAFVTSLGAGDPGYGVVVMAVFAGVALGVWQGPRWLAGFSRRRTFGLALSLAGVSLVLVALVDQIVVSALCVVALGLFTGLAYVSAYTLLGLEVDDDVRGRTFSFVGSSTRVVIILVMLVAPWVANALGERTFAPSAHWSVTYAGSALAMVLAGVVTTVAGVVAFRQMDDRRGTSLRADLAQAWRRRGEVAEEPAVRGTGGFFVALEGGDGSGKTTQATLLAAWLEGLGHEAVVTREPGGTTTGRQLRAVLLEHRDGAALSPRAEALLFAADRAQHVAEVVRPGLQRGAVVLTDRYVDSSLAYQGAGRDLPAGEVERLSRWATEGLLPDLTVVLDVDPVTAARRRSGRAADDRVEAESQAFHARVREQFLLLAARAPQRYLVLDATTTAEVVQAKLREHLAPLLPAPVKTEATTR